MKTQPLNPTPQVGLTAKAAITSTPEKTPQNPADWPDWGAVEAAQANRYEARPDRRQHHETVLKAITPLEVPASEPVRTKRIPGQPMSLHHGHDSPPGSGR